MNECAKPVRHDQADEVGVDEKAAEAPAARVQHEQQDRKSDPHSQTQNMINVYFLRKQTGTLRRFAMCCRRACIQVRWIKSERDWCTAIVLSCKTDIRPLK